MSRPMTVANGISRSSRWSAAGRRGAWACAVRRTRPRTRPALTAIASDPPRSAMRSHGRADPVVAAQHVDRQVAVRDDVVGVRDDEDLPELRVGERVQLLEQRPAAVQVLAAEDLVEQHEPGLGAALARERARQREAQAQRGEVLLAAGEAAQRMNLPAVDDLEL